MSELEQQKEHSRHACGINTISFTFPLTHSRQLQHWTVCVGFELDSTALEDDGTEFLQNSKCIAQSHIAEDEGTKFLKNTKHFAHCHIPEDESVSSFWTLTALHIVTSQKIKAVIPSEH